MKMPNIKKLIKKLGGPTAVAEALGITHSAVCQWKQIPHNHCSTLEAWSAQKGQPIRCEVMRPDVYRRVILPKTLSQK